MYLLQKNAYARNLGGILLLSCSTLFAFFFDILSKHLFFDRALASPYKRFSWFYGLVQHGLHANFGATFNVNIPLPLLLFLGGCFGAWILFLLLTRSEWWLRFWTIFFVGLIFGGALGNAYDRMSFGFVRDWILLGSISVWNIADVFILFGCIGFFSSLNKDEVIQKRIS